mgnify:CR=1 FL=1
MPTDNIDSVSIKRHTPLLTMTMVQEDLDNGSKELYNKRIGELPADINEFSYSIEKHEIQSIFPFENSVSDLVKKSESAMPVGSKMLYTGEMQAFPYLFRPIEPVSRLLELYMKSPFSVFLYSLFTVSVTKALRS